MTAEILNPPSLEPTSAWLQSRRTHLVRELRADAGPAPRLPAPGWRLAIVIAAAIFLLAGAALAADRLGLFDWLRSSNPGEARFSIDGTKTVSWPAPDRIACAEPSGAELSCSAGRSGVRVYDSYGRVEPLPEVTRERVLAGLAQSEEAGIVTQARADQIRGLVDRVADDFFANVEVLFALRSVASPRQVRPGVYRVPPAGVPQFVICRPNGSAFRCGDLAAAADVPVGAPIYGLRESPDWVELRVSPEATDVDALVASIWGRPLTPAEEQLLIVFSTVGSAESGAERGSG